MAGDGGFDWGGLISGLVTSLAPAAVGYFTQESSNERADEIYARDQAWEREKMALELRLQALKAQYGSGGGGGGGPFTGITDAQKVAAIQGQGDLKQESIANALNAMQNAYALRSRQ